MPIRKIDDRSLAIAAAARLRSAGRFQEEIAAQLDVSQPEVSRLLADARKAGWLEVAPRFRCADLEVWKAAEERYFSSVGTRDRLRALFPVGGRLLNRVTLIHTDRGRRIDPVSAQVVRTLLGDARTVGVTWGHTLGFLVDALRDRADETPRRAGDSQIRFVPLCGEPLAEGSDPSHHSSSVLAIQLADIFNSGDGSVVPPSLAGVPAFIPLRFTRRDELATIRRFIGLVRGYEQVFGSADPSNGACHSLSTRLDAILTSVGAVEREWRGIFLHERIVAGDIPEHELERTVAGDVGGVIIPEAGLGKTDASRIDAMNDRWTGISLTHLRRCAESAKESNFSQRAPGVLMLALGSRRRKVVLRCIELGLISELIIDQELDDALKA